MPVALRYGIVLDATGDWWAGGNHWVIDPIAARWYESKSAAELAGLRELPDPCDSWRVVSIPKRAL